jgi:hypothetical protein
LAHQRRFAKALAPKVPRGSADDRSQLGVPRSTRVGRANTGLASHFIFVAYDHHVLAIDLLIDVYPDNRESFDC